MGVSAHPPQVAAKDRERSARGLKSLTAHVAACLRKLSGDPHLEFAQQLRGDMCVMLSSKVLITVMHPPFFFSLLSQHWLLTNSFLD